MANLKFSTALRNAQLDQISALASSSATFTIYAGAQPAGGGAVGTQLARLTCGATFAGSAASGALTLSSISADANADATGTASWFRIAEKTGTNWIIDGDVTTVAAGTGDLLLDDTSIILNGTVSISGPNVISAGNAA